MKVPMYVPEEVSKRARELAEALGCTPPQAVATAVSHFCVGTMSTEIQPIPREVEGLLYRAIRHESDSDRADPRLQEWVEANLVNYPDH